MTEKRSHMKLCNKHSKNLNLDSFFHTEFSDRCELCTMELAFDKVLNLKEFRDLRP